MQPSHIIQGWGDYSLYIYIKAYKPKLGLICLSFSPMLLADIFSAFIYSSGPCNLFQIIVPCVLEAAGDCNCGFTSILHNHLFYCIFVCWCLFSSP